MPLEPEDYIELLDWTGRMAHPDKKGFIPEEAPSALSDLKLKKAQWRMLALETQKALITMFNGLNNLAAR